MTNLAKALPQQKARDLHIHHLPTPEHDALAEIVRGLRRAQKQLSPKFFYDSKGSRLFDAITGLPEYYPTCAEQKIFSLYKSKIRHALSQPKPAKVTGLPHRNNRVMNFPFFKCTSSVWTLHGASTRPQARE